MRAINLKTEYLQNPMGIDMMQPRLQWNCESGVTQTAYQVVCRDENGKILWDSGKADGKLCVFLTPEIVSKAAVVCSGK